MKNQIVQQTGPEISLKIISRFHKFNIHPIKADWYDVEISTGAASIIVSYDIFKRFNSAVDKLIDAEENGYRPDYCMPKELK